MLIWVEEDTNPVGLLDISSHVLAAPLTYEAVSANDDDTAFNTYDAVGIVVG